MSMVNSYENYEIIRFISFCKHFVKNIYCEKIKKIKNNNG